MQGDITRSTFDPKKGYTSVRMQQGRLQLDSDWNEQADIQNYLRRAQVTDMIGAGSGAAKVDPFTGAPSDISFQLQMIETAGGGGPRATDIVLLPGHFYTNGVLCELAPGSTFEVKKIGPNQLQISPSLTIDGRRLQVGDWLVLAEDDPATVPATEAASEASPAEETAEDEDASGDTSEDASGEGSTGASAAEGSMADPGGATGEAPAEGGEDPSGGTEAEVETEEPEAEALGNVRPPALAPTLTGWRISKIVDQSNRQIEVIGGLETIESTKMRRMVTYTSQPDLPLALNPSAKTPISEGDGIYFAYLDVWQRHITAVDDPTIREVALNVPDTTTRTQTVWQLKLRPAAEEVRAENLVAPGTSEDLPADWQTFEQAEAQRAPQMNACARLCPGASGSGTAANSRLGNFLYRVEIHTGNDGDNPASPTFKWSRQNASIVSPVQRIEDDVIRIAKASQAAWDDSKPGQWLELLTTAQELRNEPGILVPLESITDNKIVFNAARIVGGAIPANVTKVRRWDHRGDQGAIPISETWSELENGIKVKFKLTEIAPDSAPGDGPKEKPVIYRTGDYWLIPARAATNDIEWPTDRADEDVRNQVRPVSNPLYQPPKGIEHLYALLAVVKIQDKQIAQVYDQRILFPPLLRALDRAGGTISGSLTVQKDLSVKGNFATNTFQIETFEIVLNPTSTEPVPYGLIQASPLPAPGQIQFAAEPGIHFGFLNGDVNIGQAEAPQNLTVEGTIRGLDLLKNGQTVALASDLETHTADTTNPHRVTATQVDTQGGENRLVTQINAGTGVINAAQIHPDIARTSDLNGHIANQDNPHRVTAAQVDGGSHGLITRINDGANDGQRINQNRLDEAIQNQINTVSGQFNTLKGQLDGTSAQVGTLQTSLDDHLNATNPHGITADQISALPLTGGNITGFLSANQLSAGAEAIPSLEPPATAYIQGNLYVDGNSAESGKIFAKNVSTNSFVQVSSETLKDDINDISGPEVAEMLARLHPVKFRYRDDGERTLCAGFIAEEMPDLLATSDHRGVKLMDVIAILTKAVQDNRKAIKQLTTKVVQQDSEINALKQALRSTDPFNP